ncbi:hypothetical protein HanRHA438_Chr17g0838831 [Helianthus annuus]|nr:hypothetical protein HanHA300_Chr17g0674601 [Helianthus annuus]KAJ0449377.1 hypothetical protein HanHA89_Chr17g0727781 [Helianthus annuus]KAJ0828581.1 hypothetical protein HanRHA438_Chr17g0838831 [Helianthus annuus]
MLYLYTVPQSKFEIHLREFRNRRKDAVELSWKGQHRGCRQWRSLRFPTGGSKTNIPQNFYKTGGQKRIYPKISIRKLHTLHY